MLQLHQIVNILCLVAHTAFSAEVFFVIGGEDGQNAVLSDVQQVRVSPCDAEILPNAPSLPYKMRSTSVAVDRQGNIYVLGGIIQSYGPQERNKVLMFDKNKNAWISLPTLLTARYQATAFYIDNHLYIIGGRDIDGDGRNDMECLDLLNIQAGWQHCNPSYPFLIVDPVSCVTRQWVWITCGASPHRDHMYRWQPGHDEWKKMATRPKIVYWGHLMTCTDDHIYTLGHKNDNNGMQVYDISANAWSQVGGPLPFYRTLTRALYLPSPLNQIIIPAGRDPYDKNKATDTLLRYDIATATWSKSGNVLNTAVDLCIAVIQK